MLQQFSSKCLTFLILVPFLKARSHKYCLANTSSVRYMDFLAYYEDTSTMQCLALCDRQDRCVSINYNLDKKGRCELTPYLPRIQSPLPSNETNWRVYYKDSDSCLGKEMPIFVIKHMLSGKFWHPYGGSMNPSDNTNIVIHRGFHDAAHFKFDQQNSHWGYIVHVGSGKVIQPRNGSMWPSTGDEIVLHSGRHAGAYFAIDQARNVIIHRGGQYTHPYRGDLAVPPDYDNVIIYTNVHARMKFELVSPTNTSKEVLVYGEPQLTGKWKIINMVLNPSAEHTDTLTIRIGKSKNESTETSFKYSWEASCGINIDIFSASMSQSLEFMLSKSSSATWYDETTRTREITVKPGQMLVTWQFVYDVTQDDHMGVYKSNIVGDTDSESNPPKELDGDFDAL